MGSEHVLAYPTPPGVGGLGQHAAHVLEALVPEFPDLRLYGPDPPPSQRTLETTRVRPRASFVAPWRRRYTWLRYFTGRYQHAVDRGYGRWLASELSHSSFRRGYFFTQIAHESLELAGSMDARTILDSPTGHIRDYREQLCAESQRWIGRPYLGHPTEAMVRRVEDEYQLASRIRVSSSWSKCSLVSRGVSEDKIFVVPQPIDIRRFTPPQRPRVRTGPLTLVFVGSVSLAKGFPYLLRAMSRLGGHRFSLRMVGGTGDRWSRRLLEQLRTGLDVIDASGDPRDAYQSSELFVLPSLHDGFGLVVAEAMACGLPVITTDACGASEWIAPDRSGWVVPRGDEDAWVAALDGALAQRARLADMGRIARHTAERLSLDIVGDELRRQVSGVWEERAA